MPLESRIAKRLRRHKRDRDSHFRGLVADMLQLPVLLRQRRQLANKLIELIVRQLLRDRVSIFGHYATPPKSFPKIV
jgi:hypothetical protein